ncbi:hypothetical protein BLNAU_8687 [Blattamonas nauphoetae]|uniref:Protein kinase domain-containing protein n=1 Tax=Blattamonas nauphoetae TaxID=2049346 RepID=A0ABQ9XXW7_9EUKA|nr:hypothetical protein BLNAU_8687 [Blattamonas nauphoetae]
MVIALFLLLTGVPACLDSSISAYRLSSVLNTNTNFSNSDPCGNYSVVLPQGSYIGDNVEIAHRLLELTGELLKDQTAPKTTIIASSQSEVNSNTDDGRGQHVGSWIFCLTNSTLSLKWMLFSLVDNSTEVRMQKNVTTSPRLAVVSDSMLTISESTIEVFSGTCSILISGSTIEESAASSSVVVNQCRISSEIGQLHGLVETSAFPAIEGSVSVSIVGCSFHSQMILGKDGIGLSLTRTARKNGEDVGMISPSLIDCSFVNMSSICSSNQPCLPNLSQKMLGCVVSLTSSHLSGSTIRDMNIGGSFLCSNSSFSFLLPSPHDNTDPSIILPNGSTAEFVDGTEYSFSFTSGSASFSNCHFSKGYTPYIRPLSFLDYDGTITVLSCSFTNLTQSGSGGAICVSVNYLHSHTTLTINSSNFTNCSAVSGGAVITKSLENVFVNSCHFEGCSTTQSSSEGGGALFASRPATYCGTNLFSVFDCLVEGCTANSYGGGLSCTGCINMSIVDTKFECCKAVQKTSIPIGGGVCLREHAEMTMEGCHFIECSSTRAGSAIASLNQGSVNISDTLVKNCRSESTGAICFIHSDNSIHLSFSHVFFDGNLVGDDTTFFSTPNVMFTTNATKFTDVAIMFTGPTPIPTQSIDSCFTTTAPDSGGMIIRGSQLLSVLFESVRHLEAECERIGPLLIVAPIVRLNEETETIELEMKGQTPLTSQEYVVTVKENVDESETTFKMLFSDGTGTLVPESEDSLQYNTSYTITKIVGVVPASSSSTLSNDVTVPVAAWAFNLAATPDFLIFTTPAKPVPPPETPSFSTLQAATAHIIESDPQSAFVVLLFDKEVCGSYDFVVDEEGKDVKLTINNEIGSKLLLTKEFKVIGNGKLLTHDTTYTIKSIVPTPGTESMFVFMDGNITFHIPKSPIVPPKDPKDQKKSQLSPEMKKLLSWLIPLVLCLLVALLFVIVIIVLLRRRQQRKAQLAQKEMEVQDEVEFDEKMEVLSDDPPKDNLQTERRTHSAFDSSSAIPTNVNRSRDGNETQTEKELVEVIACSGAFEVSLVEASTTLYSVLHKEKRDIGKRALGLQIVNGLKAVLANRQSSDVVTRLSSHWILLDTAGNVQLKLQMTSEEAEQEAVHMKQQYGISEGDATLQNQPKHIELAGIDGLRWRAPEVVAGGGSAVDGHKASVFSLGLVLWEIETGQVPFGELDAVNAQRQSATGIGPKMESLQNEEFIALILQCVSANPEQRPSLSEIGGFLSSHPEESHLQTHIK